MPEATSLAWVKEWATKRLPLNNELRDAILSEDHNVLPAWEALIKIEVYSRMLDAKAKRMSG